MRYLFKFTIFVSILIGQRSIQSNLILKNQIGMDAGIFANFGNSGPEIDGYFELKTSRGVFIEASGITQISEKNTVLNTSIGIMNEVTPNIIMGGGYSHYLEMNNEPLHEFFFGASSNLITGIVFLGLNNELSPNYLGTINLNELVPSISFDLYITGIMSNQLNKFGCDLFLNLSKTFESGFSIGYIFSNERYEGTEEHNISKDGYSKQFMIPVVSQGLFNTIFIGWNF